MAGEETPQEQEERLQRREERLERQHKRLKDPPPKQSSGQPKTDSLGGGFSELVSFFGEHKLPLLFAGTAIVLISVILYIRSQNSSSANTANQPNDTGTAQNPGYQDVGTAEALDQLTQQLDAVQQQLSNPSTTTTSNGTVTPPPNTSNTGPGAGKPVIPKSSSSSTTWPSSQGLLGPNVRILVQNGEYFYRSPSTQGKFNPVPLPLGTTFKPGASGRYYYYLPGSSKQKLLTSGAK